MPLFAQAFICEEFHLVVTFWISSCCGNSKSFWHVLISAITVVECLKCPTIFRALAINFDTAEISGQCFMHNWIVCPKQLRSSHTVHLPCIIMYNSWNYSIKVKFSYCWFQFICDVLTSMPLWYFSWKQNIGL